MHFSSTNPFKLRRTIGTSRGPEFPVRARTAARPAKPKSQQKTSKKKTRKCPRYFNNFFHSITFQFKQSRKSNNGTDVGSGQIPALLYKYEI